MSTITIIIMVPLSEGEPAWAANVAARLVTALGEATPSGSTGEDQGRAGQARARVARALAEVDILAGPENHEDYQMGA